MILCKNVEQLTIICRVKKEKKRKMRAKDRGTQLLCEIVFCLVLS